jgi:hypothetical protein
MALEREGWQIFESEKIQRGLIDAGTRPGAGMRSWREKLFAAMVCNASIAAEYFKLPANWVLELGPVSTSGPAFAWRHPSHPVQIAMPGVRAGVPLPGSKGFYFTATG